MRIVKVLLTVTSLEFFGPILRDYSPSHAFNPTWVGHARVHLVWLLGFMFFSGLACPPLPTRFCAGSRR